MHDVDEEEKDQSQFSSVLRDMDSAEPVPLTRRLLLTAVSLLIAAAIWLPCMHLLFEPDLNEYRVARGIAPRARSLAARHLALWEDPALRAEEFRKMRGSNAEWDFMGRTYLVLAFANMGLREPASKGKYLRVIDAIIDDTLAVERDKGMYHFLMGYARSGRFMSRPPRSMFIDGEIALMLAARRMLAEKPAYKKLLTERVDLMTAYMSKSPVLSGESYPDECWTFCNMIAVTSIKLADALDGTDHSTFISAWLAGAKKNLIDRKTGLLISSYGFNGPHGDGPEGSSIWMVAHCLQLIDEEFARDQYARVKKELARTALGFGYAREWPETWRGPMDSDSGPIIPLFEASPGSSGLAVLGASAFGDTEFLSELVTSLDGIGLPRERDGALQYCASNQVGDAVVLYALVQGPLWEEAGKRSQR